MMMPDGGAEGDGEESGSDLDGGESDHMPQ